MSHAPSKIAAAFFLALFFCLPLFGQHEINGSMTMYFNSAEYWEEWFMLKGKLGVELDLAKGMTSDIALYMDEFEVNPDEITVTMKLGDKLRARAGYKENFLTMDEFDSSFDRIINETGLITEYYDYLGYVARYTSLELYDKNDWYFKGGVSNVFPYEPQFNGSYFFHPFGKNSFYGLSALYLGNWRKIYDDTEDSSHHFAFTLHAADTTGPWLYSVELATGSNISSPISYMTLPTEDGDRSYFFGADGLIAYKKELFELEWIPGLRYSLIMPDAAYGEYFTQRFVLANQLYLSEDAKLFADFFLEHERPYLDLSGDEDIYTLALYAGIQIKTN
ncbi:MAG: hypothetical protein PQJ59_03130 [Spirochaetales bacterium]|nr:hypothetical protein [Spirochaetales bacterium]